MIGKTGFFISMAGLILLAIPEEKPAPKAAEISGMQAIDDRPDRLEAPAPEDKRPDAIKSLSITRELAITRWLEPGQYVWDEDAAASATGPATVVVNLRSRTLSVYRSGVEIGRSSILYGFGDHPTPLGTFPVKQKKVDHHSRTYNAPMPHMLRLTDDGVALHGSAMMANDRATHGCIGLPKEFAEKLYDQVGLGDNVVIWSGRADG